MSRSPVKIHVTPNRVAPAPALTSSVDYKSERFLVFLPLFPSINKLVLHRQSKNTYSSAWKCFEGGRRSSASQMHSVHFPMDKVGYTSESRREKTATASRCLAPERSQEQAPHASLPSKVADCQDGADGSAVSNTGPVETAADQVETDPGVKSQGRSQAQLQRSADFPWLGKERKQETNW